MKSFEIELGETLPPKCKKKKQNVRDTFPKVYKFEDSRTGKPYWLVDARSKRWGMNDRPTFGRETEALDRARAIARQIDEFGGQTSVPKGKVVLADIYQAMSDRLAPFGRKPEEAVDHFVKFLGDQLIRQTKPSLGDLVDQWQAFKRTNTTLSKEMIRDIRSYSRFIKSKWGEKKPDELKKNEIDLIIRGLKVANNTRRKYLRFIRMFFSWVQDEGHISKNPTDGIKYKPDDFSGGFYTPEVTSKLLRYVVEHEKDLIGWYISFSGLT